MLIDLLSQYSIKNATDQNQATIENMFLEEEQKVAFRQDPRSTIGDQYQLTAYPTFGLVTFSNTAQANVRALYEHNDIVYCVAGNKFGTIASNGTFTQLGGNLNTSTGFAKIKSITGSSDTNNQLIIIDGTNGYSYNLGTSTATFPIADTDFPQTATDIDVLDEYVILLKNNSISYMLSNISDSLSYEALDFASKIRKADKIVAISVLNGELWLFGTKTTEVWIDTGDSDFPFERRPDVFLEEGCAAKQSVVVAGTTLHYLAKARTGGYAFIQVDHYDPKVISTKAIMYLLNSFSTVSDCIGYAYAKDGHEFIDWTFPTANKTLTFDVSNGSWIIRTSNISSTYGRFLGSSSTFCYGKSLIGDSQTGIVYYQDSSTFTENGTAIRRKFTSPNLYLEGKYFTVNYLQIDVQQNVGASKTFLLEMSTDHGITWSTVGTYTVPTEGDNRIRVPSLGGGTVFTFRITTTDDFKFVLLGFQADINSGAW